MEDELTPQQMVETPVNIRPDLTDYGIEEYDRGICEDTYENRAKLRKNRLKWYPIWDKDGNATQHIEVVSNAMSVNEGLATLSERSAILEDPSNKNSDYLMGMDLLFAPDAPTLIPPWVLNATRTYSSLEKARESNPGKLPSLVAYPSRCKFIKADGIRCMLWCAGRKTDDGFCRTHLTAVHNRATTGALEKARNRIHQAAPAAVDQLEALMEYADSEPVRLKAATEILDRAGVRAGFEIDVSGTLDVRPAGEVLRERLDKLREGKRETEMMMVSAIDSTEDADSELNTVTAEIVEDGHGSE